MPFPVPYDTSLSVFIQAVTVCPICCLKAKNHRDRFLIPY